MSRHILFLLITVASTTVLAATEAEMIEKAYANNYYSQRNLAYSYATGWGKVGDKNYVQKNTIRACAWYKTILKTQPDKFDNGDVGNERVYCKPLSSKELELAMSLSETQANKIQSNK